MRACQLLPSPTGRGAVHNCSPLPLGEGQGVRVFRCSPLPLGEGQGVRALMHLPHESAHVFLNALRGGDNQGHAGPPIIDVARAAVPRPGRGRDGTLDQVEPGPSPRRAAPGLFAPPPPMPPPMPPPPPAGPTCWAKGPPFSPGSIEPGWPSCGRPSAFPPFSVAACLWRLLFPSRSAASCLRSVLATAASRKRSLPRVLCGWTWPRPCRVASPCRGPGIPARPAAGP